MPHHFENAAVFFVRPPATGKAQDMRKTTAVTMASGRLHEGSLAGLFMRKNAIRSSRSRELTDPGALMLAERLGKYATDGEYGPFPSITK